MGITTINKITLSTSKVVLLRDYKIKHQELAVMAAAPRCGDNQFLLATMLPKELLKILLVSIDGKEISNREVENLDDLFSVLEYSQLLQVINELSGGKAEMGKYQLEVVNSGAQ